MALLMAFFFDTFQEGQEELGAIMESLPEALKESFNITSGFLSQAENFFAGEFLAVFTLSGGVMGVFFGVGALRSKIESGYMTTMLMSAVQRWQIVLMEWLVSLVFWITSASLIGVVSWYFFTIFTTQEEVSLQFFLVSTIGAAGIQIFATGFGMLMGMFLKKTPAQAIGNAALVGMWLLDGFSGLSGYPEFLKPINPFSYFDEMYLIQEYTLYWPDWLVLVGSGLVLFLFAMSLFQNKDVV
jgi:ABC-type transport system involved in multi-copper enzyme maturation permease subunit